MNAVRVVPPGALRALRQQPDMNRARTNAAQAICGRAGVATLAEGAGLLLLESAS